MRPRLRPSPAMHAIRLGAARLGALRAGLALAAAAAAPAAAQPAPPGFVVIVNAAGPASVSRAELSRAFLKTGGALLAVDLGKNAEARAAFSRAVLGRPTSAVATYWQQQIFAGRDVPPPEKGSDAAVVAFVRANPLAVGYVSAAAALPPGVRRVDVR